jgi:cytochrome c-type biogenesis protein CcmF
VVFGTFLTRSGVLSSVHAFANSPIGPFFMGYVALTLVVSTALLIWRWPLLQGETEMKSMLSREALFLLNNLLFMSVLVVCFWGVVSPLASELFTNQKVTLGPPFYERANSPLFAMLMLLMAVAPLSAWGLKEENMRTKEWAILEGVNIFITILLASLTWKTLLNQIGSWTFVIVFLALLHVTPLALYFFKKLVWKPAVISGVITVLLYVYYTHNALALFGFFLISLVILVTLQEFWRAARARQRAQSENFFVALSRLMGRNRRRYGGYIVHISMMLMAVGILGIEIFQTETQGALAQGEELTIEGYTVQFRELASWDDMGKGVNYTRAVVDVYKNGVYLGKLTPRSDFYFESQQSMSIPGQRPTLRDDLYILLVNWEPASNASATFKVLVNPLVNWLWVGGLFFLIGIIFAAWPDRDPAEEPVRASRKVRQASSAD